MSGEQEDRSDGMWCADGTCSCGDVDLKLGAVLVVAVAPSESEIEQAQADADRLRARVESYAGGDRAPSPPVALLREERAAEERLREALAAAERARKAAASPAASPADRYHAHLDACSHCASKPFDLCATGALLLRGTAVGW